MIRSLSDQQCFELLTTTTIGRVGFASNSTFHILPVNFALSGREVIFRTSQDGLIAARADVLEPVAFEVDYHDPLGAMGWSVLAQGLLSTAPVEDAAALGARVNPWADPDRSLVLKYRITSVSGRAVRRETPVR